MTNSNDTLFGARPITVKLLDGTELETKVRKLTLGEYQRAFPLFQADDELGLTALICGEKGESKTWLEKIHPDSYEALVATVSEVNQSFFAYAARKVGRALAHAAQAKEFGALVRDSASPSPSVRSLRPPE